MSTDGDEERRGADDSTRRCRFRIRPTLSLSFMTVVLSSLSVVVMVVVRVVQRHVTAASERTCSDAHDALLLHSHLLWWLWERPQVLAPKYRSSSSSLSSSTSVVFHSHLDILCRRRRRRCRRRRQQFYIVLVESSYYLFAIRAIFYF